ncbi:MAG: DUF2460 domain-containing protein [bacterium]|nr:DUF2460 domain-containing protein [bacterium]
MNAKKRLLFSVVVVALLLFSAITYAATTGTGSVSPTVGGASGGGIAAVSFASSGQPSWSPIAGSAGSITGGDLYTADSSGANAHAGDVFVTLYLENADELANSYSYFNQLVTVQMLSSQVTGETVGTGDGSTTVFLLDNAPVAPGTLVVYLNGAPQTETTNYTVNYKTGQVTFTSAPGAGVAVTADYWYNNPSSGTQYKQAPTSAGEDISDTLLSLTNGTVSFVVAGDSGGVKYKIVVESGGFYTMSTSGTLGPVYFLSIDQA